MERNELIKRLRKARSTEESAVRVYTKHLRAITQRSKIDKKKKGEIREVLESLIDENKRHYQLVNTILSRLEGGEYDDNK